MSLLKNNTRMLEGSIPDSQLASGVGTSANNIVKLDSNGNLDVATATIASNIQLGNGTTDGSITVEGGVNTHNDLVFKSKPSNGSAIERMRIDTSGNLLINTTSYAAGQNAKMLERLGQVFFSRSTTGQAGQLVFQNPNGSVGQVVTTGSSTTYNTTSDYRLKENVSYDFDATTKLKQLKPCQFNWISDEEETVIDGFIAHEVQEVVPQAVVGEKDATNDDGSIKPQGIDNSHLVPLLVKTIQELEARIATLEAQ